MCIPAAPSNVLREAVRQQPSSGGKVINSMSCPQAWGFLYRLCKGGEDKGVHPEILEQWRSGGPTRNKLLSLFVTKCFSPEEAYETNRARLEAVVRLRQLSRDWTKTLKGYEWLTATEMSTIHHWSETLGVYSQFFVGSFQ